MLPRPAHRYHQRPLAWKFELDWDNDGFGPTDDISSFVLTASFKSSLGNGLVGNVGHMTLTLGNEQRLFTPTNRMGRYYGRLIPRLPIRVTVNDGDNRVLFAGYTDAWSASNVAHGQQTATLDCVDLMGLFQTHTVSVPVQEDQRSDVLLRHVLNDALRAPAAQATYSFSGQPSNNDTITVDGYQFKFKTTLSAPATENEVLIGATFYDTIDNALAALNGGNGDGTTYKCPVGRSQRVAASVSPSYYHEVRDDAPIRWYRLGEPSGTTAVDSGLNDRDGTYAGGVTLAAAGALLADKAASFDGTDDYVSVPTINLANKNYTVEAWVKPSSSPPSRQAIFGMFDSYATGKVMNLEVRDDGSVYHVNFFDDLQTAAGLIPFGGAASHIALTIDAGANVRSIYVNGVLVAQNTGGVFTDTNPVCTVGAAEGTPSLHFKGDLDEVAVYDYALTATQVYNHYLAGDQFPALVAADAPRRYYRLGDQSGTTAVDSGSDGQDGTYTGGVTLSATCLIPRSVGDVSTAASFDGTDDYVSVPTLEIAGRSYSVEFWFKPAASPPTEQHIFSARTAEADGQRAAFILYDTGQFIVNYYNTAMGTQPGAIAFGSGWYHAVATYHAATDVTSLYLNGALVDSIDADAMQGLSPTLTIGAYNAGASYHAKADIDEVAIYWETLPAERIAAHYAARAVTPGIIIRSVIRGAAGNGIPMLESATNVTVSGSTAGGSDLPTDALIDTGLDTFDVAGDTWNSERTNVMACIQDICESERAFFWVNRAGQPVFKNRGWLFRQAAATPKVTLVGEPKVAPRVSSDEVYTVVKVSVTPRSILAEGVVAKSDSRITVEGTGKKNEDGSWTRFSALDNPKAGVTTLTLQYVDPGTGQISGAKNLVVPLVPYDDYTAWDFPDGTGFDYTDNGVLSFGVIPKASGVELDVHNSALGPLYLFNLQVQGQAIVAYDAVTKEAKDQDAVDMYGTRTLSITLPLASSEILAAAVAHYMLSRYKTPQPRITQFDLGNRRDADQGISMFSVEIGDVVYLNDDVLGITAGKYLVTGYSINWGPGKDGGVVSTTFDVMQLDDVTYAVFDDPIYGILNVSARLSI